MKEVESRIKAVLMEEGKEISERSLLVSKLVKRKFESSSDGRSSKREKEGEEAGGQLFSSVPVIESNSDFIRALERVERAGGLISESEKLRLLEERWFDKAEINSGLNRAELRSIKELIDVQDQIDEINNYVVDKILEIESGANSLEKFKSQFAPTGQVSHFWQIVLSEHEVIRSFLQPQDHKILKYLYSVKVEVEELEDEISGYSIALYFKRNPYFEDEELKKTFIFLGEKTKVTATSIKWKKEEYIPHIQKKQKIRPILKQSFFTWFSLLEEAEMFEDLQDVIADSIIRDIWPNPVSYFERALLDTSFCLDDGVIVDDTPLDCCAPYDVKSRMDYMEDMLRVHCEIQKTNKQLETKVSHMELWCSFFSKSLYVERNEIIKNIPDFWTIALLSHPVLNTFIREYDEQIFKHLISLEVESIIEFNHMPLSYTISFNFGPGNKYFKETKLAKTYTFCGKETKITATPITWTEGKLNVGTYGRLSPGSEVSFFSWFNVCEDVHLKQMGIVQDDSDVIAISIKEDLWLNPLSYFHEGMKSWTSFED
ncbi:NAP1-related protein 2 [Euphorbia peplus]|nr:NAP1-related protein 2 [Euphorbia peplus]